MTSRLMYLYTGDNHSVYNRQYQEQKCMEYIRKHKYNLVDTYHDDFEQSNCQLRSAWNKCVNGYRKDMVIVISSIRRLSTSLHIIQYYMDKNLHIAFVGEDKHTGDVGTRFIISMMMTSMNGMYETSQRGIDDEYIFDIRQMYQDLQRQVQIPELIFEKLKLREQADSVGYIITSGSWRKIGHAKALQEVYTQAGYGGKKNSIIIHRCRDQETVCAHLSAWLIAQKHIDNGDDIIREDADHDAILTHIKSLTKTDPISTLIIDLPKLFDK